jgi:hypothetical protein
MRGSSLLYKFVHLDFLLALRGGGYWGIDSGRGMYR